MAVSLEAFSPFIPLNAADSGIPGTYFRYTVRNVSTNLISATLTGWLRNVVGINSPDAVALRQNTLVREDGLTFLACSVNLAKPGSKRPDVQAAQYRRGDIVFTRPCVASNYQGTWPDDCMWPYMGDPALAKLTEWRGLLQWLTDAIVDLPVVPDRVEFDDVAVLTPGGAGGPALSDRMPLHLPSAWTRYLVYAESLGVGIPRKAVWAQVIRRSFEQMPFSYGLVYSNPQLKIVGFGFHDTIHLTGQELMTSLITYCGLQRAARLF